MVAGNPAVANRMRRIAERMRQRGLTVEAMDGWADRGRSDIFNPVAVVYHHTAAIVDVDRILRDGRGDLPGPLCNFALHRDGTWVLVAAGRANHAGVATVSNTQSYGVEATGPIPTTGFGASVFPNYAAYVQGVAAILETEGWTTNSGYGHKEIARPLGRKIDPSFDIPTFEAAVRAAMSQGPPEDDMPLNDADKQWLAAKFEASERRTARYVDHGDADTTGSDDHHERIRSDIADLRTDIQALTDAVTALQPGPPA